MSTAVSKIDRVVDRREHAVHHQLLDDLGARGLEAQRELADCDLLGHGDRDVLRLALGRDAVQALGSVSRFALRGLPRRWLFWLIFCFAATVSFFTLS